MYKIDEHTTIIVQEGRGKYAGTFSLIEGWVGRDGEFRPNFCERKYGKGAAPIVVPVSVKLGTKETAVDALAALAAELENLTSKEEVPF